MTVSSPLLAALGAARADVPADFTRFDAAIRGGAAGPSFDEYSARIGEALGPWRATCYFDLADPGAAAVADERFLAAAGALELALPGAFVDLLRAGGSRGDEVLQIVAGVDAGADARSAAASLRLKYYLVFRADAAATVERLRLAVGAPPLPAALDPATTYIVGVDFTRAGLHDFKVYVRLDPARVPAAIRNLERFAALWRGSRYLVFQRCVVTGGAQVYFHAASAAVLEEELARRARREPAAAALRDQVTAMNAAGPGRWRPWIASLPYAAGRLADAPANIYFHRAGDGP